MPSSRPFQRLLGGIAVLLLALMASPVHAQAAGSTHSDPLSQPLLGLACVLVAAKLGGDLAVRLGQAAVLGELLAGVLIGNLDLLGVGGLKWIASDHVIDIFARLGVILLLFEVGLESTVAQMLRTGWSALLVAIAGVAAPFGLGWGVGSLLLPDAGTYAHVFIGATLTATSVGITARVLKDLDQGHTPEARIILGAAVVDDVLGLVILAMVTGIISAADAGRAPSLLELGRTLFAALGFLVGALVLGVWMSPRLYRVAARLRSQGVLLALSLGFCFVLAWSSSAIGLAPIVGAFAAGLILEKVHYTDFVSRGEKELEELIHPITSFLVPIFFVIMGMRTELRAFAAPGVLALSAALIAVAVLGKLACGLGVLGGAADRLVIGLGMIPRGEVGLIFADIGRGLTVQGHAVVSQDVFSSMVVMVIVTTMVTPPLLRMGVLRSARRRARGAGAAAA